MDILGTPAASERRIALVTGASSGIGYEMAFALAVQGYHVVMACRNPAKSAPLRLRIEEAARAAWPGDPPPVDLMWVDFASLTSVRDFSREFLRRYTRLDALLANAGTFSYVRQLTEDGFERTMAVNYLGMVLMIELLLPRLRATASDGKGARIVVSASAAAFKGSLPNSPSFFRTAPYFFRGYAASKLAQVLYTLHLAMELHGTGVTAVCIHPGVVATGIFDGETRIARFVARIMTKVSISPIQGAQVGIRMASDPAMAAQTGGLFGNDGRMKLSRKMRDSDFRARFVDSTRQILSLFMKS